MSKCENCDKSDVCVHRATIKNDTYAYMGVKYDTENCPHFKDKSLFVELPCKVGIPVFYLDEDIESRIYSGKVCSVIFEQDTIWIDAVYDNGLIYNHPIGNLGNTLFFTKEEAEKKLKEIENE